MRAVDASLKRLNTDTIDLYYIHRVDPDTRWEQTIQAFGDLIKSEVARWSALAQARKTGVVRHVGQGGFA